MTAAEHNLTMFCELLALSVLQFWEAEIHAGKLHFYCDLSNLQELQPLEDIKANSSTSVSYTCESKCHLQFGRKVSDNI